MLDVGITLFVRAVKYTEHSEIDSIRIMVDIHYNEVLKADHEDRIKNQARSRPLDMYTDTGRTYTIPLAGQDYTYYKRFAKFAKSEKSCLLGTYEPWRHEEINPVFAIANHLSKPTHYHDGKTRISGANVCQLTYFWSLQDEYEDVVHQMFWLLIDTVLEKSAANAEEWTGAKAFDTLLKEELSVNFQIPNPAYEK